MLIELPSEDIIIYTLNVMYCLSIMLVQIKMPSHVMWNPFGTKAWITEYKKQSKKQMVNSKNHFVP